MQQSFFVDFFQSAASDFAKKAGGTNRGSFRPHAKTGLRRDHCNRPFDRSYSIEAQMNGPTPLQSFSMIGSEM